MRHKLTTLFLLLSVLSISVSAQDADAESDTVKRWQYAGFGTANLNQSAFVNWAAGGESSFAVSFVGNVNWSYTHKKHKWENNLDMSYGIQRIGGGDYLKNEDKIDFLSKYGYELKKEKIFATLLTNFKSQFAKGYEFPDDGSQRMVSRWLAPGYLLTSAGIDFKPVKYLSIFVSPATGKFTFVRDQNIANRGTYGNRPAVYDETTGELLEEGKTTRSEFGAYVNIMFQKEIFKNVTVMTKLDLFNNYTDPNKPNRKNIDINWNTVIDMKINSFLSASIMTQLIYDND
ncbi:MAG: DUF3078 domain-containing protein, partial [Chitinophagales bacterium]